MDLVIFNAILYLSTAVIYFYKRRVIDIGFILLSIYSFVAIMAIPCHYFLNVLWQRNITLFPFLYLYIVLLLFFRAYLLPTDELCLRIKERNLNKLKLLAVIYIMSSVVVVILLLPQVFTNIVSGAWNEVRENLYEEGVSIPYYSPIDFLMMNFTNYSSSFMILLFFYFLAYQKVSKTFLFYFGLSILETRFSLALFMSSRGLLVEFILSIIVCFYLFKAKFTNSLLRHIKLLFGVLLFLILLYSFSVTASRFGDETDKLPEEYSQNISLVDYFGQSFLVFNSGVYPMHTYANGKYMLKYLYSIAGEDTSIEQNVLGASYGTGFFTFVGALYIDFGPFFTILCALLFPLFLKKRVTKRVIYLEDMYLYFFFLNLMLMGVFVIGSGVILSIIFAFIMYAYLRCAFYPQKITNVICN